MFDLFEEPTAIINGELLWSFIGKRVVIYGKILSIRDNSIYLNINPSNFCYKNLDKEESQIIVKYQNCNDLCENMIVKIQGTVMEDFSLESKRIFPVEDYLDFGSLNQIIRIIHNEKLKDLFL